MAETFDSGTKATVQKIPLLTINAGPRDKEGWEGRLKQVHALILLLYVFVSIY
jgi:ufm1-conjugating enzyme 1